MLASHGYAALNLAYFAQPGLPRGLVNIPLEYFENAIRWMRKQPWLGDRFLAAWGTSRGGELALLLGATFPDINAVSAWVPSGVMFWGIGPNELGDPRDRASWTFRGKPLPYLQQDNPFAEKIPAQERGHPIAYAPVYRFRTSRTWQPSSARRSRSKRSAARCSWCRAATIRCGRPPQPCRLERFIACRRTSIAPVPRTARRPGPLLSCCRR